MPGGAYSALSGMRMRLDDLDRLAADLANVGTAGYKTERTSTEEARRAFASALDSAIDVTHGGGKTDFVPAAIASTGRDLDMAIEGPGFFEIETPAGTALHARRQLHASSRWPADHDGRHAGAGRPSGEIQLPVGPVTVMADGTIRVGQADRGQAQSRGVRQRRRTSCARRARASGRRTASSANRG